MIQSENIQERPLTDIKEKKSDLSDSLAGSALLSTLTLAACGGGEGDEMAESVVPLSADVTESGTQVKAPTQEEAALFLQQAQFSSTDKEIIAVTRAGYAKWLDQQLNAPQSESAWDYLMRYGYNTAAKAHSGSTRVLWHKLIVSPDAVRQRVSLAWSELFVCTANAFCFSGAAYWDVLNQHALGNFYDLLKAVTLSYPMGQYLNMAANMKGNSATGRVPDQNFAREIMQLFTIGLYELNPDGSYKLDGRGKPIETYDPDTIANLAQVLTGWDFDATGHEHYANPVAYKTPMKFIPARHETAPASFLGTTIPASTDGPKALDMALQTLFNHPNVGPFVGKFLIQRLVTSNPSPAYIARVSAAFANNGKRVRGDLKAVLKAVLLDPEARDSRRRLANPTNGKLREPMIRLIQWARTFEAQTTATNGETLLGNTLVGLAQSPLLAPSVFNFFRPGYVPPNSGIAARGLVAPEFQINDQNTTAAYMNFMLTMVGNKSPQIVSAYVNLQPLANKVDRMIQNLNIQLAAGRLSAESIKIITQAVQAIKFDQPNGALRRIMTAVFLIMVSPDYLVQK